MQTLFMLSDSQWDEIKTIIEPKPRRRKVNLQVIVSGIIYLPRKRLQVGRPAACLWQL